MRRGVDKADIYSIALSPNVQWLAVSSDKGTIHVYSLRVRVVGEDAAADSAVRTPTLLCQNSSNSLDALISPSTGANPGSSLSFMKGEHVMKLHINPKCLYNVSLTIVITLIGICHSVLN